MRIAIIGAGAAGLAALRHALDQGHECVAFEQSGNVGGIWNYTEKVGTDEFGLPISFSMYKGLRTNLPKELMQYEDYPYSQPSTSYISQEEVLDYVESYATFFNLLPHIKLFVHVQLVHPLIKGRWKIKLKHLKTGLLEEDEFDAVLVCVGHYSTPKIPIIEGMDTFKGSIIHSHVFRIPEPFSKRRVLVIGGGPSGVDISTIILDVAAKVYISVRDEPFFKLPEGVNVKPEVLKIEENKVTFQDEINEVIDDVILCTGYIYSFPFLSTNCGITVENNWVKYLYKQIINMDHPTMGFINIPSRVAAFPLFGIQVYMQHTWSGKVRFFLEFLKGNIKVSKDQMMKELGEYMEEQKRADCPPHHSHFLGLRQAWYMNDLAETANIKKVAPVICQLFDYIYTKGRGKYNISYKLVNDHEFVQDHKEA